MKKQIKILFILLLLFLIVLVIVFLIQNRGFERPLQSNEQPIFVEDIEITIKNGTLTKKSATITITNYTNSEICYGNWFRIDKKNEQDWVKAKVKMDDYVVSLAPYFVQPQTSSEMTIDWSKLYGKLGKGHYRLVKDIYTGKETEDLIAVEFIIE